MLLNGCYVSNTVKLVWQILISQQKKRCEKIMQEELVNAAHRVSVSCWQVLVHQDLIRGGECATSFLFLSRCSFTLLLTQRVSIFLVPDGSVSGPSFLCPPPPDTSHPSIAPPRTIPSNWSCIISVYRGCFLGLLASFLSSFSELFHVFPS